MLNSPAPLILRLRRTHRGAQLINARPMYWLCVVQSVRCLVVRRQSPPHGLTTSVDRFHDATR